LIPTMMNIHQLIIWICFIYKKGEHQAKYRVLVTIKQWWFSLALISPIRPAAPQNHRWR
jgi:hypothetical protein